MRRSLALCLFPTITVPICRGRIQCPQVIREQPVGDLNFHCNTVMCILFFHFLCHPLSSPVSSSLSPFVILINVFPLCGLLLSFLTFIPQIGRRFFLIFSSTVTKDPLKHTFVSVEEKLSIVRFQHKHPTLLICGPNEWSLLFSNHLFKHSPCLS